MKSFREFCITGTDVSLEKFKIDMKNFVKAPWTFMANDIGGEKYLVFTYDGGELPKADLYLHFSKENNKYILANIVPCIESELKMDDYNSLAQMFHKFLQSYKNPGVHISHLSDETFDQSMIMHEETINALKVFSSCANKATGSAHPLDREKWYTFIITAYKNGDYNKLDAEMLQSFLIEDYNWTENVAFNLASEYEFGIGLLNHERC